MGSVSFSSKFWPDTSSCRRSQLETQQHGKRKIQNITSFTARYLSAKWVKVICCKFPLCFRINKALKSQIIYLILPCPAYNMTFILEPERKWCFVHLLVSAGLWRWELRCGSFCAISGLCLLFCLEMCHWRQTTYAPLHFSSRWCYSWVAVIIHTQVHIVAFYSYTKTTCTSGALIPVRSLIEKPK